MDTIQLRSYQSRAIEAIQNALQSGQKYMAVEMPVGFGKGVVLAKTVQILSRLTTGKILIITSQIVIKEKIEHNLFAIQRDCGEIDKNRVTVETEHRILNHPDVTMCEYPYVILYDASMVDAVYETLSCREKTVIEFSTINAEPTRRPTTHKEVVFSYSYKDAVNDGYLTPAMDSRALRPAIEVFGKQLLEQFGYTEIDSYSSEQNQGWDLIVHSAKQKVWVEYKTYKGQVVSPSAAISLLNGIVMRKMKQAISEKDIILLVVFSNIPSFQKDEILERYRILVWDIENLVFYSKNNSALLKQLSQITYFPIDYIEGKPSKEAESVGLSFIMAEDELAREAEKELTETNKLIQRLEKCEFGQEHSREYEAVCEKILRTLFEAPYFNRLTSQHKTRDEHFRMDLIGSLKVNQLNEEDIHPLWQMLVQHFNSHFVVFEFKNYSKQIDQNLIYITEKYLFDAALRNVAFIISRKGFSEAARFAAESCLKEHGKLILDVKDEDLVKMLELKSDKAADFLLEKLENFLMGISK